MIPKEGQLVVCVRNFVNKSDANKKIILSLQSEKSKINIIKTNQ